MHSVNTSVRNQRFEKSFSPSRLEGEPSARQDGALLKGCRPGLLSVTPGSPFGSWMRRECHRKGRITEARFKLYSKGPQVLCIAHTSTATELCLGESRTEQILFYFHSFSGWFFPKKISGQSTFLEELGLAIWQRTFDKKSRKMLLLRVSNEDNKSNLDVAAFFQGLQNTPRTCFSLQTSSHSISARTFPANQVPKRISEGDTNLFIPISSW
ncbi:uncharacterized protein LOC142418917 isoform X1 [Mycteria americana]|uniref:uncharacterized protein LOC142418917 isoform X1 n=1 Tax=Mycteria americana TaxID=33587 RepID=UPI003F58A22A